MKEFARYPLVWALEFLKDGFKLSKMAHLSKILVLIPEYT